MKHINPFMGLGGDLEKTLPNPELSAQAIIKEQSFARKQTLNELPGLFVELQRAKSNRVLTWLSM